MWRAQVRSASALITHDVLAVLASDGAKSVLVSSEMYHPFFGHRRDASTIKFFGISAPGNGSAFGGMAW